MAFGWSLFNWIADVACLAFAAYAAGGKPSLAGVRVAYAAARAVARLDPADARRAGEEAVLVPGLVSSGMTLAAAISAMLIYRLVSWIFISAIGWVVFFFMFRTETDVDPDAGLDEVDQSEAVSDAEPKHDSQRANTADTVPAGELHRQLPPRDTTAHDVQDGLQALAPATMLLGSSAAACRAARRSQQRFQDRPLCVGHRRRVHRATMSARRVGGHDGHGEIGDDRIVGSWSGRGLGNHRPHQEPTSSVLREAHARPSRVLKHLSVNVARTPEVSAPMHLTRTTRTGSGRSRTS